MMHKLTIRCAGVAAAILLLLTQSALAGSAEFILTTKVGFLAVRDVASGIWVQTTTIPATGFSDRDRLLLECGVPLRSRADFTRALEDFCS